MGWSYCVLQRKETYFNKTILKWGTWEREVLWKHPDAEEIAGYIKTRMGDANYAKVARTVFYSQLMNK